MVGTLRSNHLNSSLNRSVLPAMEHLLALYSKLIGIESPKTSFLVFVAILALCAYALNQLPNILHEAPPVIRAYRETSISNLNGH